MIVEWMRQGKSPEQACLNACQRIIERNKEKRLIDENGKYKPQVKFYAINKKGEYGGASIWSGGKYVIHDGKGVRELDCAYLYKK